MDIPTNAIIRLVVEPPQPRAIVFVGSIEGRDVRISVTENSDGSFTAPANMLLHHLEETIATYVDGDPPVITIAAA